MIENIIKLEEELRLAMLAGNVEKLDKLLADSLIFIAPQGELVTKQFDLDVQRNKIQKISKLIPSEQRIQLYDNFAIVSVKMEIIGSYDNVDISGSYRYIRTWAKVNSNWQVVAGSVTPLSE